MKTYTFEDVVSTLNQVVAYDWRGFWIERLGNHGPGAPLGGIEGSGWKLVYDDAQSELVRAREDDRGMVNAAYSIGLWLKPDGTIVDTVEGMLAAQAGIGPGMKVIAVNGRKFSPNILRDALREGKKSSDALELLVENTEYYRTFKLDYHGGEKYPHLVRDETQARRPERHYQAQIRNQAQTRDLTAKCAKDAKKIIRSSLANFAVVLASFAVKIFPHSRR